MPIYEYECDTCKFRFEKKQRFHEKPVTTCPKCEGKVHRVFHSAPIIFKGSGFYVTDSRQTSPAQEVTKKGADKKQHKGKRG